MRTRTSDVARRLALGVLAGVLLAGLPAARGQQPPPKPTAPPPPSTKEKEAAPAERPTLEDLLAQALKDNPDLRVAEARVQKAEAELNRTRLAVMQKVATLHAARKVARGKVANAERDHERVRRMLGSNVVSEGDVRLAEQGLIVAKAELETVEAELSSVLGKPPHQAQTEKQEATDAAVQRGLFYLLQAPQDRSATAYGVQALGEAYRQQAASQAVPATVGEKVRKALDMPIKVDFKDVPFSEVLEYLQDTTGISIRGPQLARWKGANPKITLKFSEQLPLRAVLQALEDEFSPADQMGDIRFVVRDYGLLVVPRDNVPPGAVFVDNLDRGGRAGGNPPAENVEGQVTKVDPAGPVTLSIGSDNGLDKGHTLEVYRLNPAKYLGRVRVLSVTAHEAVAQPEGKLLAPLQTGDRCASKVLDH